MLETGNSSGWRLPAGLSDSLDGVLQSAVDAGATAGVEALLVVDGNPVYHHAFGYLTKQPKLVPMREGALFDLASLTKVVATTTAVMMLAERGLVRLDAPVWSYLPEFGRGGKERITLRHLLAHSSGLPGFAPLYKDHAGKKAFYRAVCEMDLEREPGAARVYSDLGFMLLGWMVEAAAGTSLDRFASTEIFGPLGMTQTGFKPPRYLWKRCAATEVCPFRGRLMQGEVHDENAYQMGGVSGHAGLFSTAGDLAIFAQMLIDDGERQGTRILSRESMREMLRLQPVPSETPQALGWWFRRPGPDATVFLPSPESFGHTGFTGTSLWIDPPCRAAAILLANAIHPSREHADSASFRKPFHALISQALAEKSPGTLAGTPSVAP
jgi:CubicO group peptidase (beta-lactamase class C family)